MPDLNDVVRHVILRLVVDQAGFGEDLAKSRSRLKELEKAEHESNNARIKDSERVQKAYDGRKKAIEEERKAAESAARAARQDYKAVSGEDRADRGATARQLREDINAAATRRRADENAAAGRERADSNAANKRRTETLKVNAAIERADEESGQRIYNRQAEAEEKLSTLKSTNQKKLTTQALIDAEKVAKARLGTNETAARNADASLRRERTTAGVIHATNARNASAVEIAGARTDAAQSQAQAAASRAVNTEDKTNADIAERRRKAEDAIKRAKQDIAKVAAQTHLIEQRGLDLAERRARAEEKATTARQKKGGVGAAAGALIGDVLTAAARSVTSAPVSAVINRRAATTGRGDSTSGLSAGIRGVENETKRAENAAGRLFSMFRRGAGDAEKSIGGLGSRVKAFFEDINRPRAGGSGGNLGGDIINNFRRVNDALSENFSGVGKALLSFQGLIITAVAGLGPLAAILGAVGAAALGLASNLGALVGVFAALPGLIGAAVGGFGALTLVMQPLSNVFSAFSAAQKESTSVTKKHTSALLDYKDAVLSEQAAELGYQRAQQDLPRSYTKLSDARRQAARSIQDYRLQLQKLKFDEEGASLDVESAQRAYRRSLADPTSTALDRRIARHNVEGAQFDKRDQAVAGQRLLEDSARAFKKGVEGADAVVEAERAVQDATLNVAQSYIAWQKSILAVNKAAKEKAAGGTAAAQLQVELAKLPPETRKVAKAILDLFKPFKEFRDRLSENIFGPISTETGKFADVLKELESFLGPASRAMGDFAKKALDLLTNSDWKKFLSDQGKESGYIIGQLGDVLLAAADGFRGIVEAARPFTRFVVDGIKSLAESFGAFTNSEEGRKKVADFLELTKKRMQELWPVIKNFAAGIAGFFAALNTSGGGKDDFTSSFNKGLLSASETFKKLGEAARDPNSGFQKWLRDVRPLLHDIVGFLASAGKFFGKMFSDPHNMAEASKILKEISQKWLPTLADIFSRLSESGIISKITTAISHIFDGIQKFLANGGGDWLKQLGNAFIAIGGAIDKVSGPIGRVFGFVADTIGWLVDNVPGLGILLTSLATIATFAIGGVLLSKFSGLTASVKILVGTFKTLRDVIKSIRWDKIPLINKIPGVGRSGSRVSGTGGLSGTGAGGSVSAAGITGHLTRIEVYLRQIAMNTGGSPLGNDFDVDEGEGKGKGGKHRAGKHARGKRALLNEAEDIGEDVAEGAGKKSGFLGKIGRFFGRVGPPAGDAGSVAADVFAPSGRRAATTTATATAEGVAEGAARAGGRGLLTRAGGAALRGAKGGLVGAALSVGAELVGGAAIDHFVKNREDNASMRRGLGAVANGAGIGAAIGSIVPGVGTVVGGVVGGAIGGVYSLARDKNLRNFVGGKIAGAGHAVAEAFTGGDAKPGVGRAAAAAMGPLGAAVSKTDVGKSIFDSLNKAGGKIGNFFTHTIPNFFAKGVHGITNFFTKTLPGLPKKAVNFIMFELGKLFVFFTEDLPRAVGHFFTKTIPHAASTAWQFVVQNLWDPFVGFIKGIPGFFTQTIPRWFHAVGHWLDKHIREPIVNFVTKTIPHFFTVTIPKWFAEAPKWFHSHVIAPIANFFGTTLPNFFTKTLPAAIKQIPHVLYDHIVKPVVDFFTGIWGHIKSGAKSAWTWAKNLFSGAGSSFKSGEDAQRSGKMSGGLIGGVYQGLEDAVMTPTTAGEFVVRRSKVQQPYGKEFLADYNEGRFDPAAWYAGLAHSTAPSVRAVPVAAGVAGVGPTIVNHTVNHAPLMGDVTIHNPIRERSEHSLRRQVQIAAIRHRR